MKTLKISLIYGSIAGLIMTTSWWLFTLIFEDLTMSQQELIGYAAMLLALTMVFIGVKNYRDKNNLSVFSFKDAFLMGLYIVLVSSIIYVIGWMIYYPNFAPDFAQEYNTAQLEEYREARLTEEQIEVKKQEMEDFMALYENPIIMMGITFMEIFPIGLVVALISAVILQRKTKE